VCNPTTKEWETVPSCGLLTPQTSSAYLAFDPAVASHFNLVQFEVEDEELFLLSVHAYSSETGTWSLNQADEQGEEGQLQGWCHRVRFNFVMRHFDRAPFVNGFLHLLVWEQDQMKIVVVDVQGKARRMVPVPHAADTGRWMCCFGKSQGKLHYMTREKVDAHERVSIWVLQEYDTKEWVLKHIVDTHEVFGEEFKVFDIHEDCNVVFLTQSLRHKLVAYSMNNKEVTDIATLDDQRCLLGTVHYVPCFRKITRTQK
jgi:hypothetical protein